MKGEIILIEGVEEISQVEGMRARMFPQGVVYVSLSSQVKYELTKRELPHVNACDYYDLEELYRATDIHYDDFRNQCDVLDTFLQAKIPELARYGIRPFFLNYYNAKIILDTFKQRTMMVRGLYSAFGNKLYAFEPSVKNLSLFLKAEDRFSGYALAALAGASFILPRDRLPSAPLDVRVQADACIAKFLRRMRWRPRNILIRIAHRAVRDLSRLGRKGVVWTLSPVIPPESLVATGLRRECPIIQDGYVAVSDVSTEIYNHPSFTEIVNYGGDPMRALLEEWFCMHVLSAIPGYVARARYIDELIARDKPILLEGYSFFDPDSRLMATQFRRHGKKVIGTNHGCLGIQNEKMFGVSDLHYVSDYFVWGVGVKDYIDHHYPLSLLNKPEVFVSGTGHFEIRESLNRRALCKLLKIPEGKTIVMMPGNSFRNNIFYNWYSMMDEQEEYINLTRVIDFFAARDDCVFIYKGWNNSAYDESHVASYMADKGVGNLIYMNKTQLRHILPAVDVFITDRPSTSLLEALGNDKVCYSYNRWIIFPGAGAALYNKAAQHFLTPEAMLEKFSEDRAQNFFNAPKSRGYYNAYGNVTTKRQRTALFTKFIGGLFNAQELTVNNPDSAYQKHHET